MEAVDTPSVDDLSAAAGGASAGAPARLNLAPRLWLGLVVPKRHARRAVTRSLLKRQMRAVFAASADTLAAGCWVLRLRTEFDRRRFTSAASSPLREAVRQELHTLLLRCHEPAALPC